MLAVVSCACHPATNAITLTIAKVLMVFACGMSKHGPKFLLQTNTTCSVDKSAASCGLRVIPTPRLCVMEQDLGILCFGDRQNG
jgi:hypothetical protein